MINPISIYLIPPVLSLVTGVALAVIAVAKGQGRTENRLFALVCIWWSLLAPVFISHQLILDESRLLMIERYIHFLYVYNPVINLLFFYRILEIHKPRRIISGFILSFLLSLTTPTEYYFYGLHRFNWGYIAKGGIAFQIFGLYSIVVVAHCVYTSIKYLKREPNPFLRLKNGYLCLSFSLIGILTLLNIPAINGINLYPMGNFTFLALGVLGYGVLRHKLMDVRSVLHLTIFWLMGSSLILIPNLMVFHWLYPRIADFGEVGFMVILTGWFALNLFYIKMVQPRINQKFYKGRHNLNQIKAQFLEEIALLQNVHSLSVKVGQVIKKALPVPAVKFHILHDATQTLKAADGSTISLSPETSQWLLTAPQVIDFDLMAATDGGNESAFVPSELIKSSFSYLIPLIQETNILGTIYLTEKVDYRRLTTDEVQFLTGLGRAVSVALSNSRMYQRIADLKEALEAQTVNLQQEIEERRSAEAALRASEKKYRLVADNVLDVIWILDLGRNRLSYVSPAVERVFGYSTEEALGLSLDQILTPRSRMLVTSEIDAQRAREAAGQDGRGWSITLELEHLRKDRAKIWTEVIMGFRRDEDGQPVALLGVSRDITERRRAEALRLAKVEAEEANQAKSEFLANMSHELRTPLNHIIGFTELVVGKNFGPLTQKQEEYLQDVLNSSDHLLSLINEILDLSKVEAGKMDLVPSEINLGELMRDSLNMVKEKAEKHQIQLELVLKKIPDMIVADELKIKQIFLNLLANAVKFTPSGGRVTLSADRVIDSGGNVPKAVEIRVIDTGIGLTADDLERVFDVFVQVEQSADRNYQGTGLGLPLTRRLVELHGGRLWAESEGPGQGCSFVCQIPISDIPNTIR